MQSIYIIYTNILISMASIYNGLVAGGMALQGNSWSCSCENVWLGRWLRRWMREALQLHTSVVERGQVDNQRRTSHIFFYSMKIFSDNTRGRAHDHVQEQWRERAAAGGAGQGHTLQPGAGGQLGTPAAGRSSRHQICLLFFCCTIDNVVINWRNQLTIQLVTLVKSSDSYSSLWWNMKPFENSDVMKRKSELISSCLKTFTADKPVNTRCRSFILEIIFNRNLVWS